MNKAWRCLVCGFVARSEEPPDTCPVCGAGADQFAPVGHAKIRFLRDILDTFLPHAVAAHIPNGVLPVAVLFLGVALLTGREDLERMAFYLLVLSILTVPVSFVTGVYDWKHRYRGLKVAVFYRKMVLSSVLFLLGTVAVVLRTYRQDLLVGGGAPLVLYVGIVLAMLGVAILLGHFGGKLVFHWRKGR